MGDGAGQAIVEVFKTLLGYTHLLLVEAFFLHLMQVRYHLGLLLSSQGVDLFDDLGSIHFLQHGDNFGLFKFTLFVASEVPLVDSGGTGHGGLQGLASA